MLQTLFIITSFSVPLFAFILAIFCLIKAPRSDIAILWCVKSIIVGICGLGIFLLLISKSESFAYLSNYIFYTAAILIPSVYYHFNSVYLNLFRKNKTFIFVAYFFACIFLLLIYNTSLFFAGVTGKSIFKYWFDMGVAYPLFLLYFWIYVIASLYLLIKGYSKSNGVYKIKITYLLWAGLIGFGGGGTIIFPQLFGIFPIGYFLTFLYPVILIYGIFLKKY